MRSTYKKLLVINGSLGGKTGNTFSIFSAQLDIYLQKNKDVKCTIIHLCDDQKNFASPLFWKKNLLKHDAIFVMTGTYWDSWSSHLQRFLETTTSLECDECFFGKPIGALVSMHSVGGKEVLSRLLGVFSTQGYLIAPQTSLVISLATEMAIKIEKDLRKKNFSDDFWNQNEIPEILQRLMAYSASLPKEVKPWAVDKKDPKRQWAKLLNH